MHIVLALSSTLAELRKHMLKKCLHIVDPPLGPRAAARFNEHFKSIESGLCRENRRTRSAAFECAGRF